MKVDHVSPATGKKKAVHALNQIINSPLDTVQLRRQAIKTMATIMKRMIKRG